MLGLGALGRLLDVGTGTGRMIELLGPRAEAAIGIDRSPRCCGWRAGARGIGAGACRAAPGRHVCAAQPAGSVDTVVLHQVLHFADDPAAAMAEGARVLAPGGRLLVVDFAPHDREELRERQRTCAWALPMRRSRAGCGGGA